MSGSPGPDDVPGPVLVVGTGLVGASVGCALSGAGVRVHLSDAVSSHARVAASRGAGTVTPPDPEQVRLVVVAVPPRALAEVLADALDRYPHATVTDVGSVKSRPLAELERRLSERGSEQGSEQGSAGLERYLGSHPMAGSHHAGPVTADPELFAGRTWVVCPHPRSSPAALADVTALVRTCGARLVQLSPAEHDAAVARISHLPHLVSALVAGGLTELPQEQLALAGQGLRDVTRIAGSDPGLWEQIVGMNADVVAAELGRLQERLTELVAAVRDGPQALTGVLREGVAGTRRIPGKHGGGLVDWSRVVVQIPDAPNALGRLFTDIGDAGVNVEDITIEHDPARQVGYLSVAVETHASAALAALLADSGWTVTS